MLKKAISHDLDQLFDHAEAVSAKRRPGKEHSEKPSTCIHNGIINTLAEFARKTSYYNLDFVTGSKGTRNSQDPMASWNERVIQPIIEKHCTPAKRKRIEENARVINAMIEDFAIVSFTRASYSRILQPIDPAR